MSNKRAHLPSTAGPFRADQIRPGDPYELSNGHPILCLPTAGRGGSAQGFGATVVLNDPAVESGGVEVGFSPKPDMLRAPDVSVGGVVEGPGWVRGVPTLAIEYADTGQDEPQLQLKIADLLGEGTKMIWVVRLVGPRRVEVYEAGLPARIFVPGDELLAPGILANPVPVNALFDKEEARRVDLRNLLQRFGHGSIEAVHERGKAEGKAEGRAEGKAEGRAEGKAEGLVEGKRRALFTILAARELDVPEHVRSRVMACTDAELLDIWLVRAISCKSAEAMLA